MIETHNPLDIVFLPQFEATTEQELELRLAESYGKFYIQLVELIFPPNREGPIGDKAVPYEEIEKLISLLPTELRDSYEAGLKRLFNLLKHQEKWLTENLDQGPSQLIDLISPTLLNETDESEKCPCKMHLMWRRVEYFYHCTPAYLLY